MSKSSNANKSYYFVDVHLASRKIIGWGIEQKDEVEVRLSNGCHRIFVSKGQYNKLARELAKHSD